FLRILGSFRGAIGPQCNHWFDGPIFGELIAYLQQRFGSANITSECGCAVALNQKFDAPDPLRFAALTKIHQPVHSVMDDLSLSSRLFLAATTVWISPIARFEL